MPSSQRQRLTAFQIRLAALNAYGGLVCACCGETEERFLTIDHIHGCTKAQRKAEGLGSQLYRWLRANHYPPGYQVLCFNCNLGREKNGGVCPHQDPAREMLGRIHRVDSDTLDNELEFLALSYELDS